jgi:hypothetical protein
MIINFPNLNPIVTARGTVAFKAMVDGDTATCEISAEALQAFGATTNQPHDLLTAFVSGKCTIHDVARKLYPHTAGRWLLVSTNFESNSN